MNARFAALLGILATSLSLASACAGDLKNPERFSKLLGVHDAGAQLAQDAAMSTAHDSGVKPPPPCVLQVFRGTCGVAGCHAAGTQQVDLASDGVAERLIDQMAKNVICKGRTLVATDGSTSLFVQKLNGMPPCGVPMPVGTTLSAKDKQCLFDWVASVGGSVPGAGSP